MPLYLYPSENTEDLFVREQEGRWANLDSGLLNALETAHGEAPAPEEVFYYIYAILYAPSYREKYADFLKTDFPRVPFTSNRELFNALAELGHTLSDLHLLQSDKLDTPIAKFEGEGDCKVAKNKQQGFGFNTDEERVYINPDQYFTPVSAELWEYQIGGYQVLEKWLKDRKERTLSHDDIRTYCRIVTAIHQTIQIQQQIDEHYPEVEKDIVNLGKT